MTGAPSTVALPEWYLARDGEQFGPLSDAELRKLVEFGHLKPTDLLWREGFPEWRSARILLNDAPASAPPTELPASASVSAATQGLQATTQGAPQAQSISAAPQFNPQGAHDATAAPTTSPIGYARAPAVRPADYAGTAAPGAYPAAPYPTQGQPQPGHPGQGPTPSALSQSRASVPHQSPPNGYAAAPYSAPAASPPTSGYVPALGPAPRGGAPARPVDLAAPAPAAPVANKQRRPQAAPVHRNGEDDEDLDDVEEGSSGVRWLKRIAVLLFFTLTLAAAGWLAYPYRDRIAATLKLSSLGSMMPSFAGGAVSPLSGFKATADATDNALQTNELWRVLKREFPEWYGERVKEASALAAAGKPEAEIGAQIMQAIVALRRKHAGDALSATMPRLKTLAAAFADNLVALRGVSVEACHSFVSSGETSPDYLRLLADRSRTAALQGQLVAVFEAIADGRKIPRIYPQPKQADYNLLVTALEARGWTDADMQLFSDSGRFAAASPEKVCKMVTDWFKAQVDLNEPDAQLRLLADALKPVVAG